MVNIPHFFKRSATKGLRGNAGFTLVEMIVTVAVMAILISITTPSVFKFMSQKDEQTEEIAQTEIRKALQAYLADTGELPDSAAIVTTDLWYNKIASYTNLSTNEIMNDVWGRPRTYVAFKNPDRTLFGNAVNIYYVTLHSTGPNGKAEKTYLTNSGSTVTISGLSISGGQFNKPTSTLGPDWWSFTGTSANKVDAYSALRAGGDDIMMRFTNYPEVLERYNTTVARLDQLTQALETYARSAYAARVSFCSSSPADPKCTLNLPEKTVYYPKSVVGTDPDTAPYDATTSLVDNKWSDDLRRDGMVKLMNQLGLPAEYCCSALEIGTDASKQPKPFYYYSNPKARLSAGCDIRPTGSNGKPYLPARVTTKADACG